MSDMSKSALAAAIAGGYVLGRSRRAKTAFAVATYLAGRRFGLAPRALLGEGLRRLSESDQFGEVVGQVRGELLHAGRSAAMALANRRMDALANSLRGMTESLAEKLPAPEGHDDEPGDEARDEARDEESRPRDRDAEPSAEDDGHHDRQPKKPSPGGKHEHRDRPRARDGKAERPGKDRPRRPQPSQRKSTRASSSGR
jgi:hypothetical protein